MRHPYMGKLILLAVLGAAMLQPIAAASAAATSATVQATAIQINPSPKPDAQKLENQVRSWMDELAKQPSFASWTGAEYTIEPLGPGTHAWYVIISISGKTVGYMIVNATANGGFELGEYGVGQRPLFDMQTLRLSLERQGVIPSRTASSTSPKAGQPAFQAERLYANGLVAAWRIVTADREVLYADAATGDILPTDDRLWKLAAAHVQQSDSFPVSAGVKSHVYRAYRGSSFDIYADLPWLTSPSVKLKQAEQLLKPIESDRPIRYVTELFDQSATFIWGITGFQQWSNHAVYLQLEEPDPEGNGPQYSRYIGLSLLSAFGRFYS
ncbi:hypothetical protein [Paenibacillus sp. MMS18-CY102]|uniref:hypothetical protein n=1 Tax=Paenibacillus sp. MMS18-CY102 TaxID=2682849 RepID=UPI0013651EF9|nr:hypothetical protein [Paenibacillus sp. MMS18-CY102]MWC29313.1 hypothetical protein [Paenibacillus sp. MMS18-CY102]